MILSPVVHAPNCHKSQNWVDPKPETRSLFWFSQVSVGSQGLEPSSTAFPGHKQGAVLRSEATETWARAHTGSQHCSQLICQLSHCTRWHPSGVLNAVPKVQPHFVRTLGIWWWNGQLAKFSTSILQSPKSVKRHGTNWILRYLRHPANITLHNKNSHTTEDHSITVTRAVLCHVRHWGASWTSAPYMEFAYTISTTCDHQRTPPDWSNTLSWGKSVHSWQGFRYQKGKRISSKNTVPEVA